MEDDLKGKDDGRTPRQRWTETLRILSSAVTPEDWQRELSDLPKINPGKVVRSLLEAWGYSLAARGRKKGNSPPSLIRGRDLIEETLQRLFPDERDGQRGETKARQPVASFNAKLSGNIDLSVRDSWKIAAALLRTWPEQIPALQAYSDDQIIRFARSLVVELLQDITNGQSAEWSDEEMDIRMFRLIDEDRVGVRQFIKDAGEQEGALIVAGIRNILIGTHAVDTVRQFQALTTDFLGEHHKGILIFVFDAAFFDAGEDALHLFINFATLRTAIEAFSLFEKDYGYQGLMPKHRVSWNRWEALSSKCCVVMRKPQVPDPTSGVVLEGDALDSYLKDRMLRGNDEKPGSFSGGTRIDSEHVLPRFNPPAFDDTARSAPRSDLYWDVLVRPSKTSHASLDVQYFIPPPEPITATTEAQTALRGRGRPPAPKLPIEDDLSYLVNKASPGLEYDDAQRLIYKAARGRLNLDSGSLHAENLNAAAALRSVRFEVMTLPEMLNLYPQSLLQALPPNRD